MSLHIFNNKVNNIRLAISVFMSSNEAVSSILLHRGDLIQMSQFSAIDYEILKERVWN